MSMMPRITCSMCVCVCVLQTFHAAQCFIFHELLVSAEVCALLATNTWVPVACYSITLKLSITSANLKDQQSDKDWKSVWKSVKVHGAILFSSDPTAFSLHSAESLVALQSSTPTPKLRTTKSGAVRSSRLHVHMRKWQRGGTAYGTIFCQDVNGILGLWTTRQLKLNLKDSETVKYCTRQACFIIAPDPIKRTFMDRVKSGKSLTFSCKVCSLLHALWNSTRKTYKKGTCNVWKNLSSVDLKSMNNFIQNQICSHLWHRAAVPCGRLALHQKTCTVPWQCLHQLPAAESKISWNQLGKWYTMPIYQCDNLLQSVSRPEPNRKTFISSCSTDRYVQVSIPASGFSGMGMFSL